MYTRCPIYVLHPKVKITTLYVRNLRSPSKKKHHLIPKVRGPNSNRSIFFRPIPWRDLVPLSGLHTPTSGPAHRIRKYLSLPP